MTQLRLQDLAVGPDGRNRCLLSAFEAKTGRNQPSNKAFIFGPSCWLRSLIKPGPRRAIAYLDWSGQEYGIAARLSGDEMMQRDYASGDPYLAFAKKVGAVPADATKRTHPRERELFKTCCGLGAMYGAGPDTLAQRLGVPRHQAQEWLQRHHELYPRYWTWSDAVVTEAMLTSQLRTVFGWTLHLGPEVNPRSLRNFPMQANGAEMLRLACCLATERRASVCAPVHDAILIEAAARDIDEEVAATRADMEEASRIVLDGFALRTDVKIVRYPDRYIDKRGERMWELVMGLLPR
jgi:DNA polymerase I-like protein with 3'-5' exonuclease and polymerase domains